ncbi:MULTISPECIES: OprD family outer membrane porin [Pseudomonas chlororaphis group]|uniref:OprD family outer membrane porin n=1 Tax=Pseudomonas chlororaphis group TaxID=136842 RepID=UPI002096DD40|nr:MULTISPECIES: OprD family outer membrane porin [Pseudomonas chlororaphis group]MCO7578300.1 OprD family porin [Pseudomonas protegens]MCO7584563.1 OprD family porin [Pseudomonas chlororaphis]MCO7601386.1 OprD family porin [Pseudomonas chlororaphis]
MNVRLLILGGLGLTLLCPALAHASQAQSRGFVEDSRINGLVRNNYRNNDHRQLDLDAREWGQGLQLDYASGYTQGTLGWGLDAHAYFATRLDSGGGRARTMMLVSDSDGSSRRESATAGAALKMRLSNTEFKYGDLRPQTPVLALADNRLMPATATGLAFSSREVEGLLLEGGHFTASRDFNQTGHRGGFHAGYARVEGGDASYLGGTYQLHPQVELGLYSSRYQDLWRQHYVNLNLDQPLDAEERRSLNLDLRLYRSLDDGKALAGDIAVTAWSAALALKDGPHTVTLAHQRIHGQQPFDYLALSGGGFHGSIYLANASLIADFNGPGERSWSLGYRLDLEHLGLPGLSFGTRYIRGSHVDGRRIPKDSPYRYYADKERQWERDIDLSYRVQSGVAKDLSLSLRQGTYRIHGTSNGDVDHIRLVTEYPFSLL